MLITGLKIEESAIEIGITKHIPAINANWTVENEIEVELSQAQDRGDRAHAHGNPKQVQLMHQWALALIKRI